MPIRDSLLTLRRKGASYRTIANVLRKVGINVSLDTLARFCREHVEQTHPRKNKRRSNVRPSTGQTDGTPPPVHPAPAASGSAASTKPPKEADSIGAKARTSPTLPASDN